MSVAALIQKNLKGFMAAKGLNQVQLAAEAGLKQPVVSRALNGEMHNPEVKTLAALAEACGRKAWELIQPADPSIPALKREFIQEILQLDDTVAEVLIPNLRPLIEGALQLYRNHDLKKLHK